MIDQAIEHTIPDKPASRLQRYRLTEKGRSWLDTSQVPDQAPDQVTGQVPPQVTLPVTIPVTAPVTMQVTAPVTASVAMQDNSLTTKSFLSFLETFKSQTRQVTRQVARQVTGQVTRQVAGQVASALNNHFAEPKTAKEFQNILGLKDRETFVDNYLNPALKVGFLERTIPDKPNSRLQKYRLTKKGRAWLGKVSG